MDWTQPAGVAPTAYVIAYSSTIGRNPPQFLVVPAPAVGATIPGLMPSTCYNMSLQALRGICPAPVVGLAAPACTSALGPCASGTTFANAWATQVVANGGAAPSQANVTAIANFQCGLITDGLDTKMLSWNALVSDNLIACITPQLQGVGSTPWTNTGFVNADLTTAGLKGDGIGKWLNTNIQPQSAGFWNVGIVTNAGCTVYLETNTNAAAEVLTGCSNGGASLFAFEAFGGNTGRFMFDAGSTLFPANAGFTGYISLNRTAVNALAIYEGNSSTPHNTLASNAVNNTGGAAVPPFVMPVFAYTDNTGTSLFTVNRLGFIAYHLGLSAAQSALFFARVQTLMTAFGRNV